MSHQVATLTGKNPSFTASHRKEDSFHKSFSALIPADYGQEMAAVVDLRIYWPATVAYAAIWIRPKDSESLSGTAKAGGYGYCKLSAAAGDAIRNAGISLSKRIDGVGEDAVREAVLAIATAIGYPDARLFVAHG